ncbi:MAG: hypothetical protein NVS9B15_03240 [Acidobacteriaceae bacterium]
MLQAKPSDQVRPPRSPSHTVLSTNSPAFLIKRLVGTWEQPPTEENQLGQVLTLSSDGAAQLSSAVIEDLNYNFDGKKLIVVDGEDPDDIKQTSTIALTGDSMKETNEETKESAEFVRISPPPVRQTIVGTWKRDVRHLVMDPSLSERERAHRLEIAERGRYYYTADGRLLVRIPLSVEAGKWRVTQPGTLHLEFGGKARDAKVEFEGEDLVLVNPDGSRESFDRFEP